MKSYKLIKKYPGSPKVGTILKPKVEEDTENTNNFYWEGSWFNPKDFCEFWEEVIEKDYEIVAARTHSGIIIEYKDGVCIKRSDSCSVAHTVSLDYSLNNGSYSSIYSVKRLSDGEVFTVGDSVDVPTDTSTFYKKSEYFIKSFYVVDNLYPTAVIENGCHISITVLKKSLPIIFTTEDGVDMRKHDMGYRVDMERGQIYLQTCFKSVDSKYKYFSNFEKAEYYLFRNRPCLSVRDIERTMSLSAEKVQSLINVVKSKI